MIETLIRRIKVYGALGVLVLAVGGIWYVVEGYGDYDENEFSVLGPRQPGYNKQFDCRMMTIEVEGADDDERPSGRGRLNADLGTAGKIVNQPIVIRNPEAPDESQNDDWAFKQEFCAKPGSRLTAAVVMELVWDELECFFRSGPRIHADDNTTRHGKIANTAMTTCVGIVP